MAECTAKPARAIEGDELPVKTGKRARADIPAAHPLELQRRPRAKDPRCDLLRVFPHRNRHNLAGNDQVLPVSADASHEDMGVGIVGVPVIDRQPFKARPDMALKPRHRLPDERTKLTQACAILGADDQPEVTLVGMPALRCLSRIERVARLVIEGLIAALSLARKVSDRRVNVLPGGWLLVAARVRQLIDLRLVRTRSAFPTELGDMRPECRHPS